MTTAGSTEGAEGGSEPADSAPDEPGPAPDAGGEQGDRLFVLASERTYLAWVRTSLGVIAAAGLAAIHLLPNMRSPLGWELVSLLPVGLGLLVAVTSFRRWTVSRGELRVGAAVVGSRLPGALAVGMTVAAIGALVLLLFVDV